MPVWRSTTYSDYLDEPPQVAASAEGKRVTRRIILHDSDWRALDQAQRDFIGFAQVKTTNIGKRWISRTIPHLWDPLGTGRKYVWCQSSPGSDQVQLNDDPARKASLGDPDIKRYSDALLSLEYRSLPFDVLADEQVQGAPGGPFANISDESNLTRYVSRHVKGVGALISIPRGNLYAFPAPGETWPAGPCPLPEGLSVPVSTLHVTINWHQVPIEGIPFNAIQAAQNGVNSAVFDPFRLNYPPKTVFFKDYDFREYDSPLGARIADVQYNFLVRIGKDRFGNVLGWNSTLTFIPGQNIVDFALVGGATGFPVRVFTASVFKTMDWTTLFRPD